MRDLVMMACFSLASAIIVFGYIGYPALMILQAGKRRTVQWPPVRPTQSVSVVMSVFDEEQRVAEKLLELQRLLDELPVATDIVLIDDGSTDATAAEAKRVATERTKIVSLPRNAGKANALNRGVELAQGEILVLADVRQRWTVETLPRLLDPFADPEVGAVGGALQFDRDGQGNGVGLYWRIESALRKAEAATHSSIGVSGAICAVRKSLIVALPDGLILDDVYWPMHVVRQGYRVVYAEKAVAFDSVPDHASQEFRRKVRTLAGNFQLLQLAPWLLSPRSNPLWGRFMAHKVMRLAAPWAMVAALLSSAMLVARSFFGVIFGIQLLGYALGGAALALSLRRPRPLAAAGTFLLLNAAGLVAFCQWAFGREGRLWTKTDYRRS